MLSTGFPECNKLSKDSWKPILVSALSVSLAIYNVVWGLWMVTKLRILGELKANAVTKALGFSVMSAFAGLMHQGCEFLHMLIMDRGFHVTYYYPGTGINTLSLCVLGFGIVLCDLSIPLLWIGIVTAGMNKADSAKKMARSEKIVKNLSITFVVSFIACAAVLGLPNTGVYSVLWFLGLTFPFNYGGRVMSKQVR